MNTISIQQISLGFSAANLLSRLQKGHLIVTSNYWPIARIEKLPTSVEQDRSIPRVGMTAFRNSAGGYISRYGTFFLLCHRKALARVCGIKGFSAEKLRPRNHITSAELLESCTVTELRGLIGSIVTRNGKPTAKILEPDLSLDQVGVGAFRADLKYCLDNLPTTVCHRYLVTGRSARYLDSYKNVPLVSIVPVENG